MKRKIVYWAAFAVAAVALAVIQFIPPPPVLVPAQLPQEQRAAHRLLNFEGIRNFRDLGGYPAADGKHVRWGALYRAANLAGASRHDLQVLPGLDLYALVDFRSAREKDDDPDRLPDEPGLRVVDIPVMDAGNGTLADEMTRRLSSGDMDGLDPDALMAEAYRQFPDRFTPQFAEFFRLLLEADGKPVLWHCTAGKDRTGYASAVLLRLLGAPRDVIFRDYMQSGDSAVAARRPQLLLLRLTKGEESADKVAVLLGVRESWLQAAFDAIDQRYGSFDNYLVEGLGLDAQKQAQLRRQLLE